MKDQDKSLFKISNFIDEFGNKVKTSYRGNITGIVIPRIPSFSYKSVSDTGMDKDHLVPGSGFEIFSSCIRPALNDKKSKDILGSKEGFLIDFMKKSKISISLNQKKNKVKIQYGQKSANSIEYYYSDFYNKDDSSSKLLSSSDNISSYINEYSGIQIIYSF